MRRIVIGAGIIGLCLVAMHFKSSIEASSARVLGDDVTSVTEIPADYVAEYHSAAAQFGLPWQLLAAVGTIESDNGQDPAMNAPNVAGAIGPMQFLPATFAEYRWAAGDADPSILDPHDSIYAAAAMLAANGAPTDTQHALFAYNHADWYVNEVLSVEQSYLHQTA